MNLQISKRTGYAIEPEEEQLRYVSISPLNYRSKSYILPQWDLIKMKIISFHIIRVF